jgi:single-stranded DNA-binding protein
MSVRRHLAHVGANLCAFNTGTPVTNLRVAVTQRLQHDGEWRDGDTSFFRVNVRHEA